MSKKKVTSDVNMRLQEFHVLASMIGAAFAGSLPRQAPQVREHSPEAVNDRILTWVHMMRG